MDFGNAENSSLVCVLCWQDRVGGLPGVAWINGWQIIRFLDFSYFFDQSLLQCEINTKCHVLLLPSKTNWLVLNVWYEPQGSEAVQSSPNFSNLTRRPLWMGVSRFLLVLLSAPSVMNALISPQECLNVSELFEKLKGKCGPFYPFRQTLILNIPPELSPPSPSHNLPMSCACIHNTLYSILAFNLTLFTLTDCDLFLTINVPQIMSEYLLESGIHSITRWFEAAARKVSQNSVFSLGNKLT